MTKPIELTKQFEKLLFPATTKYSRSVDTPLNKLVEQADGSFSHNDLFINEYHNHIIGYGIRGLTISNDGVHDRLELPLNETAIRHVTETPELFRVPKPGTRHYGNRPHVNSIKRQVYTPIDIIDTKTDKHADLLWSRVVSLEKNAVVVPDLITEHVRHVSDIANGDTVIGHINMNDSLYTKPSFIRLFAPINDHIAISVSATWLDGVVSISYHAKLQQPDQAEQIDTQALADVQAFLDKQTNVVPVDNL